MSFYFTAASAYRALTARKDGPSLYDVCDPVLGVQHLVELQRHGRQRHGRGKPHGEGEPAGEEPHGRVVDLGEEVVLAARPGQRGAQLAVDEPGPVAHVDRRAMGTLAERSSRTTTGRSFAVIVGGILRDLIGAHLGRGFVTRRMNAEGVEITR